ALRTEELSAGDRHGYDEYLKIIDTEVQRCRWIVESLLDFSRPKGGDKKPTDVNSVVERTLFLLKHHARFKRLTVMRELASGLPSVLGDHERLIQSFMALMLNAMDAMDSRGTLTVRSRINPDRADEILLEIVDTGTGRRGVQGAGAEAGRRRLRHKAVLPGGAARSGGGARAAPHGDRAAGAQGSGPDARHGEPRGRARWEPPRAHSQRIRGARVPDAPSGSGHVADSHHGVRLGLPFRPRYEHRGRRDHAAAQEDRPRARTQVDPHGARGRLRREGVTCRRCAGDSPPGTRVPSRSPSPRSPGCCTWTAAAPPTRISTSESSPKRR